MNLRPPIRSNLALGLAALATLLVVSCAVLYIRSRNEQLVSTKSAILTAKEYAREHVSKELELDLDSMDIETTVKWNTVEVYFQPRELVLGGDLWVIVDRRDGKIIEVVFGQ